MNVPFILRAGNRAHEPFIFVRDPSEWVPSAERLVASEFIEAKSRDGLRWKYRCFCFGEHAIPARVHASSSLNVRESTSDWDATARSNYLSLSEDPFREQFVRARKAIGIDACDFDYSIVDGEPVVWEANHPPVLNLRVRSEERPALERIYAALEAELFR